ncbi:unnamed protein product, partial [Adineta ricciae]
MNQPSVLIFVHLLKNFLLILNIFYIIVIKKKAYDLETFELELALLTLIELLQEQFNRFNGKKLHFTYYDLMIPASTDSVWTYNDYKLIFADTLVEYIRTRYLLSIYKKDIDSDIEKEIDNIFMNFMPEFLTCLQVTLNNLLIINNTSYSDIIAKL